MENSIKIDDLGVPLFSETPISCRWLVVWNVIIAFPFCGGDFWLASNSAPAISTSVILGRPRTEQPMVSILSLEAEGHGASSKGSPPTAAFVILWAVLREDGIIDWRKFTCLSGESRWIELEMALVCLCSPLSSVTFSSSALFSPLFRTLFSSLRFCSLLLCSVLHRGHNWGEQNRGGE